MDRSRDPAPSLTKFLGIDYNLIDASLLVVDQGSEFYLSFGSYLDGIYQIRMKDPLTLMPGAQPVHLVRNTTQRPDSLGKNPIPLPPDPIEGSFQFAWPVHGKIHFFLFFSSGTFCGLNTCGVPVGEEYKVLLCRSIVPTGPFVDKERKSCLLENGRTEILGSHGNVYTPGGQGVYYDDSMCSLIICYHYRKLTSQSIFLDRD